MDPATKIFSRVVCIGLFFSIFGFWVFDFFDFQLQSVSFETGALLISMRWRFLDSLLFFYERSEFLCSDDEHTTRTTRRSHQSGDFGRQHDSVRAEVLAKVFWLLPRFGFGIIEQEIATNSWWDLLCVFWGPNDFYFFFFVLLQPAMAYADRWLAVCLHLYICISFCLSYSLQAQYVAKAVERLQVHSGICGYVLDSHPTHAKSVDHEMNSHKYNGGKSKEQPPEKQKQKEPQTLWLAKSRTYKRADGRTDRHVDI